MPGIDLTTLNGPELKRLLKIAHARNDGPLADRLEWEIASRGAEVGRAAGPFAQPAEDYPDEPDFQMAAPDAEPFAPEPELEPFVLEPRVREPASGPGGLVLVSLGLVAGGLLSAAVFWGLQRMDLPAVRLPASLAMAARSVTQAAPPPAPAQPEPVAPPAAAPAAPVEAAVAPAPAPVEVAKEEPPPREPAPQKPATPKAERTPSPPPVRLAKANPAGRKSAAPDACARSTPADRLVCGDLGLELADFEMREAYVRALNARADPAVTGAGQAAWRRARDEVSDPESLARLYNQRIRELDAATAAARARRPAG